MALSNGEIYRRTFAFSWWRLLFDVISLALLFGLPVAGFFVGERFAGSPLIGLGIGLLVGIVALIIISRFVSYQYAAGQIAMMTKGVTEGELPANVVAEGKALVKEKFATVAAYFAATGLIRGIFNEVGRGITSIGESVGGDAGRGIGSVISTVVQTLIRYMCDCCLGWVFFRKELGSMKATLEGAVIYWKHGKTLMRNMGRVFGIGLLTLLIIGGISGGIAFFVLGFFPEAIESLRQALINAQLENSAQFLADPTIFKVALSAVAGVIIWAVIHSVFIRPFVLVGVLRNYMASGIADIPTQDQYQELAGVSKKFNKALQGA